MNKYFLFFFFLLIFFSCKVTDSIKPEDSLSPIITENQLIDGFKDPPVSAKPKGYWCLVNGNFDLTQMTKELKEYKEKGVGTLDIWDVAGWVDPDGLIPAGPKFMGDKSVQAIAHAIREAEKIGIEIGLTISSSWNAGGSWTKAEDGVMGLFESSMVIKGPKQFNDSFPFPEIPEVFHNNKMLLEKAANGLPSFYKEVAILAFEINPDSTISEVLNISDKFQNSKLVWTIPSGNWKITRYVCTGTGQPLMRPSPNSNGLMIDHFSAKATKRHFDFFFDKLEAELGDLSKTALKYLYSDSYEANSAVWTAKMPEEFKKRMGYDIAPYLPILNGYTVKDKTTSDRFLFDFKRVLSDLIIENHYEYGHQLCQEKGLDFIAEAGGPGPPLHNVPFESLSSLGKLGAPRGEFWFDPLQKTSMINGLQIVKGPASAAHLYNRPRVEAEAFTGTQIWQFGLGDLKAAADRAMCEGLTSFVYHTSPHIPREAGTPGWVYNFGTIINTTRAWWDKSSGFHHYLGRSCFLLQQGNFVGDVLYYYGDKAPNFVSPKKINPALGFGYDYDVCNSDIILNRLDVKDGYFVLPHGQKYKVLVLPDGDEMPPQVLAKIAELVRKGGVIIGTKPLRAHGLSSLQQNNQKVKLLSSEMWTKPSKSEYGKGVIYDNPEKLREILETDLDISPDVQVGGETPSSRIDFIHRQTEEADIYFFRNTTAQEQVYDLTLRSSKGCPEFWNPDNSEISKISTFIQKENNTRLPLKLDAFGSAFVVFRGQKVDNPIIEIQYDGAKIFPNTNSVFPLLLSKKGMVSEKSGDYQLNFTDGTQQNFHIETPDKIRIEGSWEMRFPYGWGTPIRTTFDNLISWTESKDEAIRHFSGVGVYHKTFKLKEDDINNKEQIILDLGMVSKIAEVYLNGKKIGTRWFAPYVFDISETVKSGENNLIVEVVNVLSNRMTGDASRKGREKRTHSNITKGPNAWMTPYKDLKLVESGLMGPVNIHFYDEFSSN